MEKPTAQQIEARTATSRRIALITLMSVLISTVAIAVILFFIGRT
ncbi:MAG: hypothetical protein V1907_03690 [Candidatus Kerfeldbacteria bacterium]